MWTVRKRQKYRRHSNCSHRININRIRINSQARRVTVVRLYCGLFYQFSFAYTEKDNCFSCRRIFHTILNGANGEFVYMRLNCFSCSTRIGQKSSKVLLIELCKCIKLTWTRCFVYISFIFIDDWLESLIFNQYIFDVAHLLPILAGIRRSIAHKNRLIFPILNIQMHDISNECHYFSWLCDSDVV